MELSHSGRVLSLVYVPAIRVRVLYPVGELLSTFPYVDAPLALYKLMTFLQYTNSTVLIVVRMRGPFAYYLSLLETLCVFHYSADSVIYRLDDWALN